MKISTLGIPFKEVGKRLDILNRELNKHGMAVLADSEATIEFGDVTREVATELTVKVALFDKPITSKNANETISELIHKKIACRQDRCHHAARPHAAAARAQDRFGPVHERHPAGEGREARGGGARRRGCGPARR